MKPNLPTIELTEDGSSTLRHHLLGDAYHSLRGAVGEAGHVFIDNGLRAWHEVNPGAVRVLEVGLGSGLNCWLTTRQAIEEGFALHYTALELYPVAEQVWRQLEYARDPLFCAINQAAWEEDVEVGEGVTIKKLAADLVTTRFDTTFDLVYMDAFAPDTQPEMWRVDVFTKIYAATAPGGMLVTYCAKGDVKRALRGVGYRVERLPGALGKRHMLRALK